MEPGRRRQQRSSARGRDGSLLDRPWPPWARRAEGATAQVGAEQDCLAHWVDQVTFSVALGKRIEAKVHCAFKKQRHRIMVPRRRSRAPILEGEILASRPCPAQIRRRRRARRRSPGRAPPPTQGVPKAASRPSTRVESGECAASPRQGCFGAPCRACAESNAWPA
ncbi:unnamed protein product [Urochloa humidicola]